MSEENPILGHLLIVLNPAMITQEQVRSLGEALHEMGYVSLCVRGLDPLSADIRVWNLAAANGGEIPPEVLSKLKESA